MKHHAISRKTKETDITVQINLSACDVIEIKTGIGFFDHMLMHVAHHGLIGMSIKAQGDLEVDEHHTIEDVGIVLGQAFNEALGDKKTIERYGWASVPMDDACVLVSLDFSGRGYLGYTVALTREKVGDMPTELVEEFFRAFTRTCGLTLHIQQLAGHNAHHIIEATFKAFGKALSQAVKPSSSALGSSTKGAID